jgi:hypothetical protein
MRINQMHQLFSVSPMSKGITKKALQHRNIAIHSILSYYLSLL